MCPHTLQGSAQSKRRRNIIIGVVSVIIVLGVAAGLFFALKGSSDDGLSASVPKITSDMRCDCVGLSGFSLSLFP